MPLVRSTRPLLLGVVHALPLPGAPRHAGSMRHVLEHAERDARALLDGGVDGLVVENFGDAPFFARAVPPETISALTRVVDRVVALASERPVGVNVLRNDARAALGICAATGAAFLRVNVLCGAAVTDQGLVQGDAAELLRERARLAPNVLVLADVFVKHASPLGTQDFGDAVEETVGRALADGVIVTGAATGKAPPLERARVARERAGRALVLLGSGVDAKNAHTLLAHADGAIVGTTLKKDGNVAHDVDPARVRALRRAFDALRERGAP